MENIKHNYSPQQVPVGVDDMISMGREDVVRAKEIDVVTQRPVTVMRPCPIIRIITAVFVRDDLRPEPAEVLLMPTF